MTSLRSKGEKSSFGEKVEILRRLNYLSKFNGINFIRMDGCIDSIDGAWTDGNLRF
jgi:hypothetical protein